MRALLGLALVTAYGCGNNPTGTVLDPTYETDPAFEAIDVNQDGILDEDVGAYTGESIVIPGDSESVDIAATNDQNTVCWFYSGALPAIVDGKFVVAVPAGDAACAQNTTCAQHTASMNPLYQFGLELTGDSLEFCDRTSKIIAAALLNSNGVNTSQPAGDHTEAEFGLMTRIGIGGLPTTRVLTTSTPNKLMDLTFRFGTTGFTIGVSFRTTDSTPNLGVPIVDPPPGNYFAVAQVLKGPLPEHDPTNFYQYGFVFDADGNTTNNYTPSAQYPADFFKDTDRWYELGYAPSTGWTAKASIAHGTQITRTTTAAQFFVAGNVILLLIPESEFAVQNPSYRLTAFRHTGDYGQQPPHNFSGFVDPPVASGLHAF